MVPQRSSPTSWTSQESSGQTFRISVAPALGASELVSSVVESSSVVASSVVASSEGVSSSVVASSVVVSSAVVSSVVGDATSSSPPPSTPQPPRASVRAATARSAGAAIVRCSGPDMVPSSMRRRPPRAPRSHRPGGGIHRAPCDSTTVGHGTAGRQARDRAVISRRASPARR